MFGIPGDLLVEFHHAVPEFGDHDEPRRHRPIDQRITAPPAVRVGMLVGFVADQYRLVDGRRAALVLQVADDLGIGVKDMLPLVIRDGGVEAALGVDRGDRHDAHLVGGGHVVLAVRRRHVHDPGAVLGGHEVAGQHLKSVGPPRFWVHEIRERRQIARAQQVRAAIAAKYLRLFAQLTGVGRQARLGQHEATIAGPDLHIGHLRIDGNREVRRQRPRCRRPHQQVGAVQLALCSPPTTLKPTVTAGSWRLW